MLIRLATPLDAPAWFALRLEALAAQPEAFGSSHAEECSMPLSTVEARLGDPLNRIWVAEQDGVLLGSATARREGFAKSAHRTNLFAMYVKPAARRQGIARRLLDALIHSARHDLAADWLQLSVVSSNQAALALYRQRGFAAWGCQPDALRVDGRSYDETQLVLDLRTV